MKKVADKIGLVLEIIPARLKILLVLLLAALAFYGGTVLTKKPIGQKIVAVLTKTQSTESKISAAGDGFEKLVIPERETPFFTLKPANYNLFGILPRQAFTLVTKNPTDTQFVETYLKASVPMAVTQISPTEFRLAPTLDMGTDQLLDIRLAVNSMSDTSGHVFDRDYTWSYQTQGKFRITGSLPGDKKKDVPRNTGIEIVFSQDDWKDPMPLISIVPTIQYRIERHGQTLAIVPAQPLNPKTIYTVTLKKGLDLQSRHDPLTENYSFTFQTEELTANTPVPYLSINDTFIQTTPQEMPMFKVYASNWPTGGTVKTKVYKFNSGQEFIDSRKKLDANTGYWWDYYQEDAPVDTKNMGLVAQADIPIQEKDYLSYVQLPAALAEGNYLVQFWYNDDKKLEQSWVQSSSLSAFVTAGKVQTLVWANDLATGAPASSSAITIAGQGGGYYTGGNGIAVFSTPDIFYEPSVHYLQVTAKGQQLYLPVRSLAGMENQNKETANDFWSYIYHERQMYKTSDTIYFWGVVKNRNTNAAPGSVNLQLTKGYSADAKTVIAEKNIPVAEDGSYTGSLTYKEVPEGWYSLQLKKGDVLLESPGLEIVDFEKPEMKIDVSADKKAIFAGEKVNFTAQMSFFDGTPGKMVKMAIHEDRNGNVTEKTTDNAGQVNLEYVPVYGSPDYYPKYESVTINPLLSEGQKIEGYGSVTVYGSRVMLTSSGTQEKNKAIIQAAVNRVDLTQINNSSGTNTKGSLVANTDVKLKVTKRWWERVEEGTYYDFIEKVTYPSYRYVEHTEVITDQTLKTNNAGEIAYSFLMEKQKSYNADLTIEDENQRPAKSSEYFYYYEDYGQYNQQQTQNSSPALNLNKKDNLYSLNENIDANITLDGKLYPDTEKERYLFIAASRGRQDYFVEDKPQETFPFAAKYIPNITLGAVIFNGKYYKEVTGSCEWDWYCYSYGDTYRFNGVTLKYRSEDKKLDLDITADKQKYLPGETANVTVRVTQKDVPQTNAEVNLVLVDQALAAIGGVIAPDTLNSLYTTVPDLIYYGYYSHKPALPTPPQAEKGGGGGDNREIFKDTAYFGRTRTDGNGKATFTFQLADNITTWIVYSQAVTGGLDAGQAESKLVASKDFFVTNEAPREYLTGDKAQMAGAGFGNVLKQGDSVDYQAMVYKGTDLVTKSVGTKEAFSEIGFPLPVLPVGEYKSAIRGTFGNNADQVTYPFKVIDSRINFKVAKTFTLAAGDEVNKPDLGPIKKDQPIRLVIADQGQGIYFNMLDNYCYTSSNRLERWIAQKAAKPILLDRFNISKCGPDDWEQSKFQDTDGGLSQVKWSSSNLETTVWAIWVTPDGFDRDKLISYLENQAGVAQSGSMQKLYAYWGLDLLNKPHLNLLNPLTDQANTVEEKLIGALALATSGQMEKARDMYYNILADYAYTNKPYIRVQGSNMNTVITNTARALLLGSLTVKDYNPGLYAYLRDYSWQASDVVLDLSTIEFIREEISKLPNEPTKVAVSTAAISKTADLSHGGINTTTLTAADISSLKISTLSGKAEARINFYVGADGLATKNRDDRLTITRTYKKATGEGTAIKPGDIVEVRLVSDVNNLAPLGSYGVEDYLPSGLVYLANPGAYGLKTHGYVSLKDNQVVTGSFYNYPKWRAYDDGVIIYYARAAFPGTYVAEPAIFQSKLDLSVFQATPEDTVTIDNR